MNISIMGMGYVGVVSSACFAKMGHKVIGVDVVDYKINAINKGLAPIEEKDLGILISQNAKRISATKDVREAILKTSITFVCVGTPPKTNGDMDFSALEKCCFGIGEALRDKKEAGHIVVIRSTMFPGSYETVKSILEHSSGKKAGKDFYLATNPEFLREGTAIKDFFNPPMVIIGAEDRKVGELAMEAYEDIEAEKVIVNPDVAQIIKYANNAWHGLKVCFANEIGSICNHLNINSKELMELFCKDTHLNLSPYYLKPGFAFGGSCLPKEIAALKNNAAKRNIECPLINSISKSNMQHIERAVDMIRRTGKRKIGILGLSFKAGTDDLRGNPILLVINKLLNEGYNVKMYDPIIGKTDALMLNESYRREIFDLICLENLRENISSIAGLITDEDKVLKQEVVIVANRDPSYKDMLKRLGPGQIFIDLQNIFDKKDTNAQYKKIV